MGRIPTPTVDISTSHKIPSPKKDFSEEKILFSFESLNFNKYFNLEATCPNWAKELFDMLHEISKIKVRDLKTGKYQTYRVHNHENATPPCDLPNDIDLKSLWQIRISKSKGGIHGIFYENIFYIVWLDPLHNMYPDDKYGGLKELHQPTTCCMDLKETIDQLIEEKKELQEKNENLQKDIDSLLLK